MKKREVISHKNLPFRLRLSNILLGWIALDHWNAPKWLHQTFLIIVIIYLILAMIVISTEDPVEVIDNE